MNIQQPKVDLKNNFELYLEGIKVDFISIAISEVEGGIPAASITFPSSSSVLRILPSTVVQIFGYTQQDDVSYLMFEGEVTDINYQKTESTKIVVLKAISLIGSMIKARFRPADAIVTNERKSADGLLEGRSLIYSKKDSESSVGQKTISEFGDIKNESSQVVSGKNSVIGISAVFGLVDEFKKFLADDQPGGKGDFIPMLQQFNIHFEYNDLFYGLRSLAYKFGRTIFASPNPDLLNKIKIDLFLEALNKIQSVGIADIFSEAPYTLMQVLTEFQRYLHYGFLSPASYTACKPFYVKGQETSWEPLRMIYMPKMETGPPALSNIFFPEQVASFTYSRDMMAEPTRIVGKATIPLGSVNKLVDFSPCITYPDIELDKTLAVGNFTREESYRGINYKVISYSNLHSDLITKKLTTIDDGKKVTKSEITSEDVQGEIGEVLRPFTYADYLNMKYRTRQTSLVTEWSPYRMVGLPGLILNDDGVSILGIVNNLETNINAQGSATTRVQFRNARLIHDDEFEKTAFSKIPSDSYEGFEKYIIHDLTNDGMIASNELLYYKDLYGFENIGKDVYTYILHGMLNVNEGFYKLIDEKDIFGYAKNKLSSEQFEIPVHPRRDNSILNYLLDQTGNLNVDIPDEYNIKTEIRNTFLLYKAVNALRKEYESKKFKTVKGKKVYDMPQAYNYMHAINRRNIITKENYFNFIGAVPDRKLQSDDAHDAEIIFGEGVSKLRDTIIELINVQYTHVITTSTAKRLTTREKLKNTNAQLRDINSTGATTLNEFARVYAAQNNVTLLAAEWAVRDSWAEIEDLLEQQQELTETLQELDEARIPSTEIDYSTELFKPYNLTRRMHVVLAFKDHVHYTDDTNITKLKVIK